MDRPLGDDADDAARRLALFRRLLDVDGDGILTRDEFVRTLRTDSNPCLFAVAPLKGQRSGPACG